MVNCMELNPLESCEFLVLVGNVSDILSTVPDHVKPEIPNVIKAGTQELSGKCLCCAQWGLSVIVTARSGDIQHSLLFDSGPEGYGVERNANRLGVKFDQIGAAVLSHAHWDHVGGMTTALRLISAANDGRKIPVYANQGMFVDRAIKMPDGSLFPFEAVPSPTELETAGGHNMVMGDEERLLLDDFFILATKFLGSPHMKKDCSDRCAELPTANGRHG